jgi:hypothetical protein
MDHKKKKEIRREKKKIDKRDITGEEVIYIFERFLEGWKTIRIYNTMIQQNPASNVTKRKVEQVATGNCKVFSSELPPDRFAVYSELREKVYQFRKQQKELRKGIVPVEAVVKTGCQ